MPRKRNKPVRLSAGDRQKLRAMLKGGRAPARELTRARILLKADEGEIESGAIHDSRHGPERTLSGKAWPDTKIADALEVSRSTVARVRERFVAGGMEAALRHRHLKRHTTKNLDGVLQVAHLIALACSAPTSRGDRCGIRLLADRGMTSERANNPPSGELVGHALILALPASARKTQGESPTSHTSRMRPDVGRAGCPLPHLRGQSCSIDLTPSRDTEDRRQLTFALHTSSTFSRSTERTRARSATAHRPGALESRDQREALPGPGHGQRPQPQNL